MQCGSVGVFFVPLGMGAEREMMVLHNEVFFKF